MYSFSWRLVPDCTGHQATLLRSTTYSFKLHIACYEFLRILSPEPAPEGWGSWCVEYKFSAHLQHWSPTLPESQVQQLRPSKWYIAANRRSVGRTPWLHRIDAVLAGFCSMHEGKCQLQRPQPADTARGLSPFIVKVRFQARV